MKKFLALILAAMMLLSTVAFAAVTDKSTMEASTYTYTFKKDAVASGTIQSDLYLEVKGEGQIDVTVPLYLLFSTNVDGGTATVASNYTITNNNARSDVRITAVTTSNVVDTDAALVSEEAAASWNSTTRDKYYVIMQPEVSAETQGTVTTEKFDLFAAKTATTYKVSNNTDSLILLKQSGVVNMKPTMTTTPFTFVTNGDADDAIKLLTVTYTVAPSFAALQGSETTLPTANVTMPAATSGT